MIFGCDHFRSLWSPWKSEKNRKRFNHRGEGLDPHLSVEVRTVDHGCVRIGAHDRVRIQHASLVLENTAPKVLEVDLLFCG